MEKSYASYELGSELWESKFDGLLALVMEYTVAQEMSGVKKFSPLAQVAKI